MLLEEGGGGFRAGDLGPHAVTQSSHDRVCFFTHVYDSQLLHGVCLCVIGGVLQAGGPTGQNQKQPTFLGLPRAMRLCFLSKQEAASLCMVGACAHCTASLPMPCLKGAGLADAPECKAPSSATDRQTD
jgi:hypothetical protein